jgi:hypothetical protein
VIATIRFMQAKCLLFCKSPNNFIIVYAIWRRLRIWALKKKKIDNERQQKEVSTDIIREFCFRFHIVKVMLVFTSKLEIKSIRT